MEVKCHVVAMVLFASSLAVGADKACTFGVCRMADCNKASKRIKRSLDQTADPCEDFNAFACGNMVIAAEDIPEPEGYYVNGGTPNAEQILEAGKALLEQQNDSKSFETDEKMRIEYDACMDLPRLIKLGGQPMRDLVLNPIGGWPVVEGSSWNEKPWVEVMLEGNKLGLDPDYFMRVNNWRNSNPARRDDYIFYLFGPTFDLPAKELMEGMQNEKVKSYLEYMVKSAVFFRANRSNAEKEMEKVLKFEIELARLTEAKEVDGVKDKYTLGDLEALFSKTGLSIIDFLEALIQVDLQGTRLNATDDVTIYVKEYLHQLPDLLMKTDGRTIVNYILWRAVMPKMSSFCDDARAIVNEYNKAAKGIDEPEPLSKQCMKYLGFLDRMHPLSGAASSLYVRKHIKNEDKKAVQSMFPFMQESFVEIIDSSEWMSQSTKDEARSKVLRMEQAIGAMDELYCKKMVDGLYEDLPISPNEHMKNLLEISKFGKKLLYRTIEEKIDTKDWRQNLEGAHIHAYYAIRPNQIRIPAGNLQGVLFNPNVPQYLNYGAVGQLMAYAMSHGFGARGKDHNRNGEEEIWLTEKEYNKRTQCLVDQFNKIPVPEACSYLDGERLLSETFARNSGPRVAYKAYENYVVKNGPEPQLPGLEQYTPRQLFWISFGQVFCSRYRKTALKDTVNIGSLIPFHLRVMLLRNSPEFARDFQCPTGSIMNPRKKCITF